MPSRSKLLQELDLGVMGGYQPSPVIRSKQKGMRSTYHSFVELSPQMRLERVHPMIIASHEDKLQLEVQPPVSVFSPPNVEGSVQRAIRSKARRNSINAAGLEEEKDILALARKHLLPFSSLEARRLRVSKQIISSAIRRSSDEDQRRKPMPPPPKKITLSPPLHKRMAKQPPAHIQRLRMKGAARRSVDLASLPAGSHADDEHSESPQHQQLQKRYGEPSWKQMQMDSPFEEYFGRDYGNSGLLKGKRKSKSSLSPWD